MYKYWKHPWPGVARPWVFRFLRFIQSYFQLLKSAVNLMIKGGIFCFWKIVIEEDHEC